MAYVISDDCIACGTCIDECPVGAISEGDKYSINLAQNVELVLTFVLLKQFTWDNRIVCMTHNKGILLGEFPYFFTCDTLNLYTDEKGFFILSLDILFFISSRKYLFQTLRQE